MSEARVLGRELTHKDGLITATTESVRESLDQLRERTARGSKWHGEYPLEDVSIDGIFSATHNLMGAYRDESDDPDYPCSFYLADSNTELGVRFRPGSDETVVQVVTKEPGIPGRYEPVLELSGVSDEPQTVAAFNREDWPGTTHEELPAEQSPEAIQVIADVIAAARWDYVFGKEQHSLRDDEVSIIEKSFDERQSRINADQAQLNADRQFFTELKKYFGAELASSILMQAHVRLNGDKIVVDQAEADKMNRYEFIASVLTQFAEAMPGVSVTDPEVRILMRYLSDLKQPYVVDVMSNIWLQRFAQKFHHAYNGVAPHEESV